MKLRMANGNVIAGYLTEYHADDFMILEVTDSVYLRISLDDVSKIKNVRFLSEIEEATPWTYYNYTTFGITFIRTEFGLDGLEWNLHTIHGVHINDFYKTGLGIGIDRYGNVSSMPIYLGGRAEVSHGRSAPLLLGNVGYGYMWEKENRSEFNGIVDLSGGLYWELGGGITIRNPVVSYSISLSYKSQNSKIDYNFVDWWSGMDEMYQEDRVFRNIALNFGMSF